MLFFISNELLFYYFIQAPYIFIVNSVELNMSNEGNNSLRVFFRFQDILLRCMNYWHTLLTIMLNGKV